jgi:hypothetical protein
LEVSFLGFIYFRRCYQASLSFINTGWLPLTPLPAFLLP